MMLKLTHPQPVQTYIVIFQKPCSRECLRDKVLRICNSLYESAVIYNRLHLAGWNLELSRICRIWGGGDSRLNITAADYSRWAIESSCTRQKYSGFYT